MGKLMGQAECISLCMVRGLTLAACAYLGSRIYDSSLSHGDGPVSSSHLSLSLFRAAVDGAPVPWQVAYTFHMGHNGGFNAL
jgi:hypothetical protein